MSLDFFLVCGLGNLGQQCVVALSSFNVKIIAIEKQTPNAYEIPKVPSLLEQLIIGNCSHLPVLESANIAQCRAALLVTSDEEVNIETALMIRELNPTTRLVVRSGQTHLNQLLGEQLGNFIAYDPLDLPANAFALAALGNETLGFFELEKQWLQVIRIPIFPNHPGLNQSRLQDLNRRDRRILSVERGEISEDWGFHQWDGEEIIRINDVIIAIEAVDNLFSNLQYPPKKTLNNFTLSKQPLWLETQLEHWQEFKLAVQSRPIILFAGLVILGLLILGTLLFYLTIPQIGILGALYRTFVLLLGGYGDLFAELQEVKNYRWLLEPLALLLTLAGIAFVGILYALLTESLLATKFIFARKRLTLPKQNHIVLLGLGRIGQRVARLLKTWKQPIIGITLKFDFDFRLLPDIPIVNQSLEENFAKVNLATANSVVVVTDDDMLNLEVALTAHKINPRANLVIRTSRQGLSHSLMGLLPEAQVLETYRLAAEVFVGAAFGENILNLFRLHHQTILVTEYHIENQDTLVGLLLAEVAYGYSIIPLLHQSSNHPSLLFPSDDVLLREGDRLVVLATIEGLRKIEVRDLKPKTWRIRIEKIINQDFIFDGANTISRISGCSLQQARELLNDLPNTLITPLYRPQAQRLLRALKKMQIVALLVKTQGSHLDS